MRPVIRWRTMVSIFTLAAVAYALRNKRSHGTFMRVPFEFRVPTVERVRERWWNPEDERILTPHVFGIGWALNLYQIWKRLGLLRPDDKDSAGPPQD